MPKAIISGANGQDASYLAEFLLNKGYEVYGLIRHVALKDQRNRTGRIDHIKDKIKLLECDITSAPTIFKILKDIQPDEFYHLASQSFVKTSFEDPNTTYNINFMGTVNILQGIKLLVPECKFYFAATSEMFGKVLETPQTERTPFNPRSPYGIAKVAGYYATKLARDADNLFACSGILFNHESPRRGREFVTQKIVMDLNAIYNGEKEVLELGNMDAKRDWGFSGDYVEAMWMMLQQDKPDDYVIATGENHTVREFVEIAAKKFGYDLKWSGEGSTEIGTDKNSGKIIIKINKDFYRPAEVETLCGDASKAKKNLNWKPKVSFSGLVHMMVDAVK